VSAPSNLTAWERWELASFDEENARQAAEAEAGAAAEAEPPPPPPEEEIVPEVKLPTAEEIEQIYQQAHDEGHLKGREAGQEAGYQAGLKEGQTKALAEARRLAQAATKLERALTDLDTQVADALLALAIEIARAVIRQEIATRPETLLAVVREALTNLPHQHAAIYLHPEDASLLRSYMGDQLTHAGHRIHDDSKLARGDCILEAGGSQVDASVAMRWQRVLAGLGSTEAWQPEPLESTAPREEAAAPPADPDEP
jgi:flagellar assembly protein FliH